MSTRYSRLERYSGFAETLPKWRAATCAIVGLGGLGCGLALHLARLGIRQLILVDRDVVDEENLGHQVLFTEAHAAAGLPKVHAAAETISAANSDVELVLRPTVLDHRSIAESLAGSTLLFDGLDNYYGRLLLNDYALATDTPYFYAGVVRGELSAHAVVPGMTSCLRCLLDRPPPAGQIPTCAAEGLFPPLLGVANALQLHSANHYLSGGFSEDDDVLYSLTLPSWRLQALKMSKRSGCPACAGRHDYLDGSLDVLRGQTCAGEQAEAELGTPVDLKAAHARLAAAKTFKTRINEYCLVAETGSLRYTVFPGGKIVLSGGDAADLSHFIATHLGV